MIKQAKSNHILTIIAIAALCSSLNVAFHEGIHAFTCLLVGGNLIEFSALHIHCTDVSILQSKLVSGSASIANLILGFICLAILIRTNENRPHLRYFLWLFMTMNWLLGTGYWMFSGFANIGDWATVIAGWEPHALWRIILSILGTLSYIAVVWYSLKVFGRIVGGDDEKEQVRRANLLTIISYFAALLVALIAAFANPHGIGGLPAVAGLFATGGSYIALLWMMQVFSIDHFKKHSGTALIVNYSLPWIITGIIVFILYAVVLGLGLNFS